MAFDSLSERLQGTLKKVSGQGRLTEKNMEEMLSEIRLALLEADVNFQVVKEFIAATKEKALGQDVLGSLKPGQVVVKIVHDELVSLLGTSVEANCYYDGWTSGFWENYNFWKNRKINYQEIW